MQIRLGHNDSERAEVVSELREMNLPYLAEALEAHEGTGPFLLYAEDEAAPLREAEALVALRKLNGKPPAVWLD